MADLYYIDDDYYTPDGYFTYTADAAAVVASSATLSITNDKLIAGACSVASSAAITCVAVKTVDCTSVNLTLFTVGVQAFATTSASTDLSATVIMLTVGEIVKTNAITLNTIVSLSLQAARLQGIIQNLSAATTMATTATEYESYIASSPTPLYALGQALISTTQTHFGSHSLSLPASNAGAISATTHSKFNFLTTDSATQSVGEQGRFAIAFWFYPTSSPGVGYDDIISFYDSVNDEGWRVRFGNTRRISFRLATGTTSETNESPSMSLSTLDNWNYVVITRTWDSTNRGVLRISINGTESVTDTSNDYTSGTLNKYLRIGDVGSGSFTGYIDGIHIIVGDSISTTSVPTTDTLGGTANSELLLNFNGSWYDTSNVTLHEGAAALTSSASLSLTGNVTRQATASLNCQGFVLADGIVTVNEAFLTATSTVSVQAVRTRRTNIALVSTATVTITATKTELIGRISPLTGTIKPGPLLDFQTSSSKIGAPEANGTVLNWTAKTTWPSIPGDRNIDTISGTIAENQPSPGLIVLKYHFYDANAITDLPFNWKTVTSGTTPPNGTYDYPSSDTGLTSTSAANILDNNPIFERAAPLYGNGTAGRSIPFGSYERNPSGTAVLESSQSSATWTWSFWFRYDNNSDVEGVNYWAGRTLFGFWSNFRNIATGTYPRGSWTQFPVANVQTSQDGRLEFVTRYRYNDGSNWNVSPGTGSSFRTDVVFGSSASGVDLADGDWHHLVCSGSCEANSSIRNIKLFIDGVDTTTYAHNSYDTTTAVLAYVPLSVQQYGALDYASAEDFWMLPSANFVGPNATTYPVDGTQAQKQAWWTTPGNLVRDPLFIAEVYWAPQYNNLSNSDVLSKFWSDSNRFVDLEGQGNPLVYSHTKSDLVNLGYLGDFQQGINSYFFRGNPSSSSDTADQLWITFYDLEVLKQDNPSLSSQFTQSTLAGRLFGPIFTNQGLASNFTQASVVVKTARSSVNLNSTSSLTARGEVVFVTSASLTSNSLVTVNGNGVFGGSTSLSSTLTQSTQAVKTVRPSISTQAIATELTIAVKTGRTLVTMESISSITTVATKTTDITKTLEVVSTITVQAEKLVIADATISANFSQSTTAKKNVIVDSAMAASVSVSTLADRNRLVDAGLTVTTTQTTTAIALFVNAIPLTVTATVSANIAVGRIAIINASSTATLTFNSLNSRVRLADSSMSALDFLFAIGTKLSLDPYYQLKVPSETRHKKILQETGILLVDSENRLNTVPAETRTFEIASETRTWHIPYAPTIGARRVK